MTKEQLKQIRTTLKWSYGEIAKYTGMQKHQTRRMECGITEITPEFTNTLMNVVKKHIKDAEKIIPLFSK